MQGGTYNCHWALKIIMLRSTFVSLSNFRFGLQMLIRKCSPYHSSQKLEKWSWSPTWAVLGVRSAAHCEALAQRMRSKSCET
jgi:hypothetical protein